MLCRGQWFFTVLAVLLSWVGGGGKAVSGEGLVASSDGSWEEIDASDGVTVYRRTTPHNGLYEFRGVGVIDAGIPKLIALMSDAEHMSGWVYGCIKGELLERNFTEDEYDKETSGYYQIFYGVNSMPWPVKNRDYVLKANIQIQPPTKEYPFRVNVVSQTVNHPLKPTNTDNVRMPGLSAVFVLTPLKGPSGAMDKTKVDFVVAADPGGYIPNWITNIASRMLPRKTISSLQELALTERYNKRMEALVFYHYQRNLREILQWGH